MGRKPLARTLDVYINGRIAGYYRYRPGSDVSFEYDLSWLEWEHGFPVSMSLPLDEGAHSGDHVSAVFENLLPDVPELRKQIAERTSARSDRPYDLLEAIGRDCIGAMQFVPHGTDSGDPFTVEGEPQSEAQIARTLRQLSMTPLGMNPDDPFRISLAGAQEKTAYFRQDDRWLRPTGTTPTTHIFKRPMGVVGDGLDLSDSVENEFFCLLLAEEFGLAVNRAEIAHFEDQSALIVERFDRREREKGGFVRVPQEDFLQAMGLYSVQKYEQHGGPSMAKCFEFLEKSDDPAESQGRFLKAQIFNWMIAAIDGHAKNFSIFIQGEESFVPTPLYDITSVAPKHLREKFRHKDLHLAMAVGRRRHYRLDQIVPRHFEETAIQCRVSANVRKRVFEDLAEAGPFAIERARERAAGSVPDEIIEDILDYATDRLRLVTDFAESK